MEIASRDAEVVGYENMINQGKMTSSMVTNLSRPRFHGLIAKIRGQSGAYCLTRKGAAFLKGEAVPKFAIISKVTKHQEGYLDPEFNMVTIKDIMGEELPYWELNGMEFEPA